MPTEEDRRVMPVALRLLPHFRKVSWLSFFLLPRLPIQVFQTCTVALCGFVPITVAGPRRILTGFPCFENGYVFWRITISAVFKITLFFLYYKDVKIIVIFKYDDLL